MEDNNFKNEISLEKFTEIFLDISFDERQFHEFIKNKKSNLLKPLNKNNNKTIYFKCDTEICKILKFCNQKRETEEIIWNKKIIDVEEEKSKFFKNRNGGIELTKIVICKIQYSDMIIFYLIFTNFFKKFHRKRFR